jgi:hypothetical protein
VYPTAEEKKAGKGTRLILDPYKEAVAIASHNWKKDYPEAGTIVWDTMSSTARDLLHGFADQGAFSDDGHVAIGKRGDPTWMAQPIMGDYGLTQRAVHHILKFLYNQPMNVIVLFHVGVSESDSGRTIIGPGTVGKAAIESVASEFDNLFRLEAREQMVNKDPRNKKLTYHCITQKKGLYLGGFRSPHPVNPIASVELEPDPVNFWKAMVEAQEGT